MQSGSAQASRGTDGEGADSCNVFIFLIDTLRADRLGTYGYGQRVTSPSMDWLAQQGVVFENASAPAPWTMPSVASLFTSTFPCEHNMLTTYDRLADSVETLAERLKRAGYATYSLYGNGFIAPEFNLCQGFDFNRKSMVNEGRQVDDALGPAPPQPFFFYLHNVEPHDPWFYVPDQMPGFRDVSREVRQQMSFHLKQYKAAGEYDYRKKLSLGSNDQTAAQEEHLAALRGMRADLDELYDASVYLADAHVGSVIKLLQTRGLWDNTLFILVSDHGEELGERGGWLHDQSVYEEMMRVPLIIRFPDNRFAGRRIEATVSLVDVLPTIFDYLRRSDLADGARGQSLLPLIRGEVPENLESLAIPGMRLNTTRYYKPWVLSRGDTNLIVRLGRWKGICNFDLDTFELYDLDADPLEQQNLQVKHPQIIETMRSHAQTWYNGCRISPQQTEQVGQMSEETLETLRTLGYVE